MMGMPMPGTAMPRAAALALCLTLAAAVAHAAPPAAPTAAGSVTARIVLPPGEITVGDPVILKLTVTHPPGTVIDYPDAAKLTGPEAQGAPESGGAEGGEPAPPRLLVEEVQPVEAKPPLPGETSWSIRVRPFAPGDLTIPAMTLSYRLPGSSEHQTIATEPATLHVVSVLKGPGEEAADIKGPWWLARLWGPWILGGLAALALAGLAWWLWRRYRRRPPKPVAAPVAPRVAVESAWARAVRELDRLLRQGLVAQGRVKEFHVLLSEIVKRFLGGRHGFDALDRTTLEVLGALSRQMVDPEIQQQARRFLESCDLVKFAKHRPTESEIAATVEAARALIETGRPRATGPAEGHDAAGGVAA